MSDNLFVQAFVYLAASLIVVPIARRLGLGSVLGYLFAGVIIGPFGLRLVGSEGADVMHFAEFGVVMMLFLVGLELEPQRLWRMRGPILGLGGLQVLLSAVVMAIPGVALGLKWQEALAVGLILAMSSTAIALQTLIEKGLLRTDAGQKSFSVLLFQDISVIPMFALFPLLATHAIAESEGEHSSNLLEHAPAWLQGAAVLAAVVCVIGAGRFLVAPLLRIVANTGLREMFTAAALLLVIGVTLLMSVVGLSPALGTFLAGVVLANSEYRHELESDIDPFKGLLLGLFFLAVGAEIDFGLVVDSPFQIAGLLFGALTLKAAVLYGLARRFGAVAGQAATFAAALAGIGEFAFVLFGFAERGGVLSPAVADPLIAVTALSMALSPLILMLNERYLQPRLALNDGKAAGEDTVIDEHNPIILAGCGRFGQIAARYLRMHGHGVTAIDVDSDQLEVLRRFGQRVYYGDASRLDLLRAAGAEHARILIIAVDNQAAALKIVHTAKHHFPHLALLARARGRTEGYELFEAGVEHIYRETFDTSLRVGVDALRLMGSGGYAAMRAAKTFRRMDEAFMREMAPIRGDQVQLAKTARERINALEATLRNDAMIRNQRDVHAWDLEKAENIEDKGET